MYRVCFCDRADVMTLSTNVVILCKKEFNNSMCVHYITNAMPWIFRKKNCYHNIKCVIKNLAVNLHETI